MVTGVTPGRCMSLLACWNLFKRARRTINCQDCELITKHPNAGKVMDAESPYQFMHNGIKVRLGGYHGFWMAEVIRALQGHHEPQEERVFHEVLKVMPPGAIMIEVGSYWAYYSLWFNRCVSGGRTYMFEPVAHKLKIGIENFKLNQMQGVFRNAFVGAQSNERAKFVDWDGSVWQVPCVAIDDVLDREGINFLDILHADIQGSELDMLEGCRRTLAENRIGYLFISTHAGKHAACLTEVKRVGYEVVAEHTIHESCSGDGLVVARSRRAPDIPPVKITKIETRGFLRENMTALIDLVTTSKNRRLWTALRAGS